MTGERYLQQIVRGAKGVLTGGTLLGSAALVACGGGDGKSNKTPENGGVLGATAAPTLGASVAPSEIPAVRPTVTVEAVLTQEEAARVSGKVEELILSGLSDKQLKTSDLDPAHHPAAHDEMLDPSYISRQIALCDISRYGQSFGPPDVSRQVGPSDGAYSSLFLGACSEVASTSKVLFEVTNNPKFGEANYAWKQVHRKVFDDIRKRDPKISESFWQNYLIYYLQ